jgi:putative ABC transport system ATP-binding protein
MRIEARELEHEYAGGDAGFRLRVSRLEIAPGERVAIVGPSGCGKTTLLHLIAGILLPSRGDVAVDGVAWGSLRSGARRARRGREIGLAFQEFELLEYLDVGDNVRLPYLVQPALRRDADLGARTRRLLDAAGIADKERRKPRALSQGERQRVAVCRALVASPRLVLADEPTGNLDRGNATRIARLIHDEVARLGATLVMVTHDRDLLADFDRVVELPPAAVGVAS